MFIKRLRLKNLLSFRDTTVELAPLNVLIGANGSGKSNLIDVIGLLQAAPDDLQRAVIAGGGPAAWISLAAGAGSSATIEAVLAADAGDRVYGLSFAASANALEVLSESLTDFPDNGAAPYFQRAGGSLAITILDGTKVESTGADLNTPGQSVWALYRNPSDRSIEPLRRLLRGIRVYRDFRTSGLYAQSRYGVSSSHLQKDTLVDGGDNLALVLSHLDFLGLLGRISEYLKRFNERFSGVRLSIGQIVQTHLVETGLTRPLTAMRMSDGTLKFLCLLAVLLEPELPPVLCIEEPEVGLHPEAIQIVAELLMEASERTQLVVTTHSEALVDAMSDRPEAVLVCERDFDNGTQFRRLKTEDLNLWLERYSLGELWRDGEIGGTRW
jgi:predicted ATPase